MLYQITNGRGRAGVLISSAMGRSGRVKHDFIAVATARGDPDHTYKSMDGLKADSQSYGRVRIIMGDYWDGRYRREGKIWGDRPSVSAEHAVKSFLAKGARCVLIPGIGYGRNARAFVDAGFAVTGIEISEEALGLLKNELPTVEGRRGSVLETPFGGPYDAIYCFNVLHLLPSDGRKIFLKKCLDSLSEGGLAYFTAFSEREPSFGKGAETEPGTFESKPGRPVHYFTAEDLGAHFKGFVILEAGLLEDPEDHGDEGPHVHVLRYVLAQK